MNENKKQDTNNSNEKSSDNIEEKAADLRAHGPQDANGENSTDISKKTTEEDEDIVAKEEPRFKLHSRLFFGEERTDIIARVTAQNNNINPGMANQLVEDIFSNFGGSGEHLANKVYLKLIKALYSEQELYDLLFDEFEEVELYVSSETGLSPEAIVKVHSKIVKIYPSFEDCNRSEQLTTDESVLADSEGAPPEEISSEEE